MDCAAGCQLLCPSDTANVLTHGGGVGVGDRVGKSLTPNNGGNDPAGSLHDVAAAASAAAPASSTPIANNNAINAAASAAAAVADKKGY